MKNFHIVTNTDKDPEFIETHRIQEHLESRGCSCSLGDEPNGDTECVIVLGGDGTLLRAARRYANRNLPLLGINIGSLGYLNELDKDSAIDGLDQLLDKGPSGIEERMMLKGIVWRQGKIVFEDIALNDVILAQSGDFRLIRFRVSLDGRVMNSYAADGMVICTPTGSTAYNLSLGGPIAEPTSSLMILTPIAPHTVLNRSMIISHDSVVRMELDESETRNNCCTIGFDSDNKFVMQKGDYIEVRCANRKTKLIKLNRSGFLDTLRQKMVLG